MNFGRNPVEGRAELVRNPGIIITRPNCSRTFPVLALIVSAISPLPTSGSLSTKVFKPSNSLVNSATLGKACGLAAHGGLPPTTSTSIEYQMIPAGQLFNEFSEDAGRLQGVTGSRGPAAGEVGPGGGVDAVAKGIKRPPKAFGDCASLDRIGRRRGSLHSVEVVLTGEPNNATFYCLVHRIAKNTGQGVEVGG